MKQIKIALDAMGGDHGPSVVIPAALKMLAREACLHIVLAGDQDIIRSHLKSLNAKENERLVIRHTTQTVAMDESPSQALRYKKDSSMRIALNLVKEGEVQACVSAGNTGALMATARFVLKMLPGINRPAIMSLLPTTQSERPVRVLDLGANVDNTAEHLFQFAVMGSVAASAVANIENPTVGLLNIGQEEMKGNHQVKRTAELLSQCKTINYIGYVEGNDIHTGTTDVVVCDGFVGNVSLKTMEGSAKLIAYFIKRSFNKNILTRLAGLLVMPILLDIEKRIDPSRYNGATLLGLRGIVVKSHGSANVLAYMNAIQEAMREVEEEVPKLIHTQVEQLLSEGVVS